MGMSFFVSCPISNASAGPDKSGHRAPWCIIVKSALHVCPDLRDTLRPPVKGHETKKDIPMLFSMFSFSGAIIAFLRRACRLDPFLQRFLLVRLYCFRDCLTAPNISIPPLELIDRSIYKNYID